MITLLEQEELALEGFFNNIKENLDTESYIIDKNKYTSEINKFQSIVNKILSNSKYKEIKKGVIFPKNPDVWMDDWTHIGNLNNKILNGKPIQNRKYRIELINIKFIKCYPGKDYFQYGEEYERGDITDEGYDFDEITDEFFSEVKKAIKNELTIFRSYDTNSDGDHGSDSSVENDFFGFLIPVRCKK